MREGKNCSNKRTFFKSSFRILNKKMKKSMNKCIMPIFRGTYIFLDQREEKGKKNTKLERERLMGKFAYCSGVAKAIPSAYQMWETETEIGT